MHVPSSGQDVVSQNFRSRAYRKGPQGTSDKQPPLRTTDQHHYLIFQSGGNELREGLLIPSTVQRVFTEHPPSNTMVNKTKIPGSHLTFSLIES